MQRSYLESLDQYISDPGPANTRKPDLLDSNNRTENPQRFYQLGLTAHRRGFSITEALATEFIQKELRSSTELEAQYLGYGLLGQEMPALPVTAVTVPPKVQDPAPATHLHPPAPLIQLTQAQPTAEPAESTSEMQSELKLLKMLVNLLEQKLALPVTVEVSMPKLRSSVDVVERDAEDNISGKRTIYEYEDGKP